MERLYELRKVVDEEYTKYLMEVYIYMLRHKMIRQTMSFDDFVEDFDEVFTCDEHWLLKDDEIINAAWEKVKNAEDELFEYCREPLKDYAYEFCYKKQAYGGT